MSVFLSFPWFCSWKGRAYELWMATVFNFRDTLQSAPFFMRENIFERPFGILHLSSLLVGFQTNFCWAGDFRSDLGPVWIVMNWSEFIIDHVNIVLGQVDMPCMCILHALKLFTQFQKGRLVVPEFCRHLHVFYPEFLQDFFVLLIYQLLFRHLFTSVGRSSVVYGVDCTVEIVLMCTR